MRHHAILENIDFKGVVRRLLLYILEKVNDCIEIPMIIEKVGFTKKEKKKEKETLDTSSLLSKLAPFTPGSDFLPYVPPKFVSLFILFDTMFIY